MDDFERNVEQFIVQHEQPVHTAVAWRGQSINLTITFAPDQFGSKTATINPQKHSSNPTVTIALSGTGVTTTKSSHCPAPAWKFWK